MTDEVYGPVFAGGIVLMFAGVLSAFVVGNIIPDEAWESLASEGMEEPAQAEEAGEANPDVEKGREEEKGDGMFEDY